MEDVALAESRIRAETIAAEDILHDLGAISIISSDSQVSYAGASTHESARKQQTFRITSHAFESPAFSIGDGKDWGSDNSHLADS